MVNTVSRTEASVPPHISRAGNEPSQATSRSGARRLTLLIPLFIFALALPIIFFVGPLRFSPYRIVLLLLFVPCLVAWLTGAAGKIRPPDIFMLMYSLWAAFSIAMVHGFSFAVEPSGILIVESFGSYLLARWLIQDKKGFETLARSFFIILLVLLPFALFETLTSRPILIEILGKVFSVFDNAVKDLRWGLDRVQGPFEHPILFGVFCSAGFSLSVYVLGYGGNKLLRYFRPILPALMVGFSLSSGPLSALLAQGGLVMWDLFTRRIPRRWAILVCMLALAYLTIDLLSNRTPIEVLISHGSFNSRTGFNRLLIWQYGSAEALRHPLFGIGFNDWVRAWFMSASMDMFWLVRAVRYGMPSALFLSVAVLLIMLKLGRMKTEDEQLRSYRTGFLITIVGLSLAGWTVNFWNATYCMFMFLLGSGVWMWNPPSEREHPAGEHAARPSTRQPLPFTRQKQLHVKTRQRHHRHGTAGPT